jgi:hypothetical protein
MHVSADGPQFRLHKGSLIAITRQVGSTLPAGPDAACTADAMLRRSADSGNCVNGYSIRRERREAEQHLAGEQGNQAKPIIRSCPDMATSATRRTLPGSGTI